MLNPIPIEELCPNYIPERERGDTNPTIVEVLAREEQLAAEDSRLELASRPSKTEGTTAKFGTGAVRSDAVESFRYDLISPIGLREVARTCAEGAEKYGDWNWEKGMPVHDLLNHAISHLYTYLAGDRSEPHLGHAAWNVLAAIHSDELWKHLNRGTLRSPGCAPPDSALTKVCYDRPAAADRR